MDAGVDAIGNGFDFGEFRHDCFKYRSVRGFVGD